jgi:hypothetical protein
MLVALTANELNFEEFKSGGLPEKHAVAVGTWEPSPHLLETEENHENQSREEFL